LRNTGSGLNAAYHAPVAAREPNMTEALQAAAMSFAIDSVTAEVAQALEAASIPSVVLKGPGIATWLYAGEAPRLYGDSDLLLRRGDWERAKAVLEGMGFEDDLGPLAHPRMESGAGYPWMRPSDRASADLHYTLFGIGAEPEALWEAIWSDAVREVVGGAELLLPSRPARLLHICLHAVQHGGDADKGWEKPMRDLQQAVRRAPEENWAEALRLAEHLDAAPNLSTALRFLPEGRVLADRIGADHAPSADAALRLSEVPMVEGFQELAEASGMRERLALILRELFPTPTFMRWWSPLARRGRRGMVAAYLWRPLYLVAHAPRALLAWSRSRRATRS
jgi:hypothetical protein